MTLGAPTRRAWVRGRELVAHPGFGRLLAVRLSAQWGDGVFQAALGGAVLFNPERQADPALVALGLAVVLLPYSLVGPFAGALLDRWDRRTVLVVAGLVRGLLTLIAAVVVATGVTGAPLYLAALATVGVSRFVQAGLSAGLPHVVRPEKLVTANALVTTSGAIAAAIGASCALALSGLVGSGDVAAGWTTAAAASASVVLVTCALGFRRGALGPGDETRTGPPGRATADAARTAPGEGAVPAVRAVARGFADGARAVAAAPPVLAAFCAVAAHRLAFGVATLIMLLLVRHGVTDAGSAQAGVAGLGAVVAMVAAGLGVAAVLTPWLVARLGRAATVRVVMVLAAAGLLGFGLPMTLTTLLGAAFVLGLVGQAIKLCSDAAVHRDIDDAARGRVFALSDTTFNVTYVLAVAVAAALSPPDGRSVLLICLGAALYVLGMLAHEIALRHGRAGRYGSGQGGSHPAAPSATEVSTAPSRSVSRSITSHRANGSAGPVGE